MSSTVTSRPSVCETGHTDMVHDVQMDYYGRRFATCSSDRRINVFDAQSRGLLATLEGHDGPVWEIAWAHPKFGSILASCSYDHKVIVWKELSENQWSPVFKYKNHESSINSIEFAPHEFGLMLACASSDGRVSVLESQTDSTFKDVQFKAHEIGVTAVSWAPAVVSSAESPDQIPRRLVTGGCDNLVKVWKYDGDQWVQDGTLAEHSDWVRDVAWAPSIGLPTQTIASCSEDNTVVIWTQAAPGEPWVSQKLGSFDGIVWRVSWSLTGNMLAVSSGDNKVTLWKEALDGSWKCVSTVDDRTAEPLETNA